MESSEEPSENPLDKHNPRECKVPQHVSPSGNQSKGSGTHLSPPETPDALTFSSSKRSTCPWTVGPSPPVGRLQEASERRREGNGCEGLWLAGRGLREGWPQLLAHSSLHHPQDLGLEGTLLTDILYRNVAFLNLVDPISHDLLVNLARDLQCPKTVRPAGKDLRLGGVIDRPGEPRAGG